MKREGKREKGEEKNGMKKKKRKEKRIRRKKEKKEKGEKKEIRKKVENNRNGKITLTTLNTNKGDIFQMSILLNPRKCQKKNP